MLGEAGAVEQQSMRKLSDNSSSNRVGVLHVYFCANLQQMLCVQEGPLTGLLDIVAE
jgi:hypothetical protein